MRKIQVCRNCDKVFAIKETTGPGLGMSNFHEFGSKVCPSCGGNVVWMEEGQNSGPGCAGIILVFIGLAITGFYFLL